MKNILFILLLLFLYACDNSEKATLANDSELSSNIEMEKLRYLKEVEWPQAYREQDTVLLDRILGDDFQMITNDGEWSNKSKQMERIKATAMDHDSFRYEIKRLEIIENGTAIIAGTGHIVNDSIETIYQSSNILIYRDGTWKAVLSHVSGVKELE
jgi:hypothetical protein